MSAPPWPLAPRSPGEQAVHRNPFAAAPARKAVYTFDARPLNRLDLGAPGVAAYYIDAYWLRHPRGNPTLHTLSNHDYFIARRAFFFDLSPWGDEPPGDDLDQPPAASRRTSFSSAITL
jgi:hypothetical protein